MKTKRLEIRLTQEQREILEKHAEKTALSMSEFIIGKLFGDVPCTDTKPSVQETPHRDTSVQTPARCPRCTRAIRVGQKPTEGCEACAALESEK